jgi:hypothetical protein
MQQDAANCGKVVQIKKVAQILRSNVKFLQGPCAQNIYEASFKLAFLL